MLADDIHNLSITEQELPAKQLKKQEKTNEHENTNEKANEDQDVVDLLTPAKPKPAVNDDDDNSSSSFHPSGGGSSSEEEPQLKAKKVLKISRKKGGLKSTERQRVRMNLHIPPKYLVSWLKTVGRNDTTPTIRPSGKYCYGIGGVIGQAGISWPQFGRLFKWIKEHVTEKSWMRQLRRAGVGDEIKGANKHALRNHRLGNVFRGWCATHNTHNDDDDKVICNKILVIELGGW